MLALARDVGFRLGSVPDDPTLVHAVLALD
jgi:hypothetical protein